MKEKIYKKKRKKKKKGEKEKDYQIIVTTAKENWVIKLQTNSKLMTTTSAAICHVSQ